MRERSLGATALALVSVVVGIYSLVAAIALLLGASIGAVVSAENATGAFLVGIFFFGLSFAAYLVGGGFWLQRHWAWAGGIIIFGVAILLNLAMVAIGGSLIAALASAAIVAVVMGYMLRPATRTELLGSEAAASSETPA
ncbi:MAG: hypothetical protein ACC726_10415 [Chloroflexota bacterium]